MDREPFIVACIPACNEERYIASVLVRLRPHVDVMIVCDDGSGDLTGEIAEGLGAVVVRHPKNLGYGAAIKSLFKEALMRDVDVAVTIDADDQHDPDELHRLVEALGNGYDIVIGSRFLEDNGSQVPGWRRKGIEVINAVSANGHPVTDSQSGFRAYSRKALESLSLTEDGMGVSTEILLKAREAGLRIGEVPISVKYHEDSSMDNPVVHGVGVLLSTVKLLSIRHPLLFFGVPGLAFTLFAVAMWAWTLQNYTVTRLFNTNLAVVSMAATFVGFILMTTAMIIWVMVSVIREKQ